MTSCDQMDPATSLFQAAQAGNFNDVKDIAVGKSKRQLKAIANATTDDSAPLVIASRKGYLDIVKFLVEHCEADREKPGNVTFDAEAIISAPPLWCASASGHLDVVKYLIEHGANVNGTTFTNSTPLRGACFDGHYDIVKHLILNGADIEIANRHGHTCLMISCYKGHINIVRLLLEHKSDVNRKSVKGNTALHDCAESDHLDIMKILISQGANMEKDVNGMYPLSAAAVIGYANIVEYLIKNEGITSRVDRVESLELLGAAFVDKKNDMIGAIQYWKRAINERFREPSMPKNTPASLVPAYEGAKEVETIEQLDDLLNDPEAVEMQALLVRERILGPVHPDTLYYIRYRGAHYADQGKFDRCISLWMYALDTQLQHQDGLSPIIHSSLLSFAEMFSFMMSVSPTKNDNAIKFGDIYSVFSKAIGEVQRSQPNINGSNPKESDMTIYSQIVVIIIHFLSLICRLKPCLSEEEILKFKKRVSEFLKLDPLDLKRQTPLHLAVNPETTKVGKYSVSEFPCLKTVELLIELGASVDAIDSDGNTAIKIANRNKDIKVEILQSLRRGSPQTSNFLKSNIQNNKGNNEKNIDLL